MQRVSSVFVMEYQASSMLKNGSAGLWQAPYCPADSRLAVLCLLKARQMKQAPQAIRTKPGAMKINGFLITAEIRGPNGLGPSPIL
mmetsp:Transcript_34799/g.80149  ORF Transcript_34799/g.80149 Transcript_34799/m.80149 type:complete len:86 (-) Transcript_34799:442-699(-)